MSARGRTNGESRMVVSCFLHLLCHMLNDRFLIVIPCGDSFNVLAYHHFWCDFLHIWQWRGSPRWNGSGAPDLLDNFPIKTSEQSSLATSPLKSSFGSFWTCVLPKVAQQITSGSAFLDVHAIYSSSSATVFFAQLWWLLLPAFSFIVQDIVWRRALCNWGLSLKKASNGQEPFRSIWHLGSTGQHVLKAGAIQDTFPLFCGTWWIQTMQCPNRTEGRWAPTHRPTEPSKTEDQQFSPDFNHT